MESVFAVRRDYDFQRFAARAGHVEVEHVGLQAVERGLQNGQSYQLTTPETSMGFSWRGH